MAVSKPTVFPRFASVDLLNGTGGAPNVVEPSSGKKDSGWNEGERPPRETFNWLHRFTNDWIQYLDQEIVRSVSATHFAEDTAATSGLNFAVGPGKATVGGDEFETVSNTVLALVDDAVNFVWVGTQQDGIGSSFGVFSANESTVPSALSGDDGVTSILPLFRVTTVAGAITATVDLRTWVTIPFTDYDRLNVRNFTGKGKGAVRIAFAATDALPDPDLDLSNFFVLAPNAVPGAIVFQTPDNPGITNQTDPLFIAIELNNSSQTVTWTSAYNFVGDASNGAIDGADGLEYLAVGFYDPTLLEWKMTLTGGKRSSIIQGKRGALVQRTTDLALGLATETTVGFASEAFDTDSIHDNSVNNSRLTVPTGVTAIRLFGAAAWKSSNAGFRTLRIKKNGGTGTVDAGLTGWRPEQMMDVGFGGLAHTQIMSPALSVTGGDFFEMTMESDNGIDGEANTMIFEMEIIE